MRHKYITAVTAELHKKWIIQPRHLPLNQAVRIWRQAIDPTLCEALYAFSGLKKTPPTALDPNDEIHTYGNEDQDDPAACLHPLVQPDCNDDKDFCNSPVNPKRTLRIPAFASPLSQSSINQVKGLKAHHAAAKEVATEYTKEFLGLDRYVCDAVCL